MFWVCWDDLILLVCLVFVFFFGGLVYLLCGGLRGFFVWLTFRFAWWFWVGMLSFMVEFGFGFGYWFI